MELSVEGEDRLVTPLRFTLDAADSSFSGDFHIGLTLYWKTWRLIKLIYSISKPLPIYSQQGWQAFRTACIYFWYKGHGFTSQNLWFWISKGGQDLLQCVLMSRWVEATMLRQFCSQDLIAVILQYQINGIKKNIIVTSAYLRYDSSCPPSMPELRDLAAYTEPPDRQISLT